MPHSVRRALPPRRQLRGVALALAGAVVAVACIRTPAGPLDPVSGRPRPGVNAGRPIAPAADTSSRQPPVRPLPVAESRRRFVLPAGYGIEPVLSEPAIREPAAIAFDGNGRMFVLELRTYMQDANATDELVPGGRISRHEDADGDGVYERHTVFVDSLVFPRFVMPFGANSILTMESNADDVYRFTDTDGDGRADRKELFTTEFGRSGNVEHQQAFLYWAMDNWMYSTYNAFRIRWTPAGILREPTGSNWAQWGVTQDDDGKVWFQGGATGMPTHFQFPIHYGNYRVPDGFETGFDVPWGLAGLGDYQPGPAASRPDGTLNRVTGSAGNDVFRGHRLPADLRGEYIYGEPVARVVRRVRPVVTEGLTQLRNVYQPHQAEFIRSTDPLFRPVDMATAPDGTLYVVDMYRGIIQEGTWARPGTHLRAKIEQYGLDKVIGNGRVWRVTHRDTPRDRRQPRMLEETPAELVAHLEHPNGWWRDMAQQLLVLAQDTSVAPRVREMARAHPNRLARVHALWTLEGLGRLDQTLARALLRDSDRHVRIQALRASETLYKAGATALAEDFRTLAADPDAEVSLQAVLTLDHLRVPGAAATIQAAKASQLAKGVQLVAEQILTRPATPTYAGFTPEQQARLTRGAGIYNELCAQCHGETGRGVAFGEGAMIAPPLAGSPRVRGHRDYVVKTLLHGLIGPIDGHTYSGGLMAPMGENDDEWIASVASYIRTQLTNEATAVSAEDVARTRAMTPRRERPWTYPELVASLPRMLTQQAGWRATASHTAPPRLGALAGPAGAFSFEGWTTGAPQEPGMWFMVELPEPVALTEIQFGSPGQWLGPNRASRKTAPLEYRLEASTDGSRWTEVARGKGVGDQLTIAFAPTRARYLRMTQTAKGDTPAPWTMQQLRLFAAPE